MTKNILIILGIITGTTGILLSLYNMDGYVAWKDIIMYTISIYLTAICSWYVLTANRS